ncbi:unnamed protein product [Mytilus coruscus]|uniref:Reverse transcriptase RNase H-like domain-containing protein n=1 Tax=Mytilus coruscus TaxID=42192 RepID=A0A6J8F1R5_MYTCO|nr:unnamed protein product [Mytilus coruscus]
MTKVTQILNKKTENDKVYDSLSDGNKVVLRPTHTNMKLVDGKPVKVREIGKMNVEIGRTLLTDDVWVADIDEDIDCIIGFDFMKQNMCCIDVANNTMTVNKEQISCAVLNIQGVRCCRVAVSETTVIPPGVEQIIPGKVIDIGYAPECSMLVASDKFVEKHQLLLAKTVVNSSSDVVPMRVLNTTDKSVKVYANSIAATCEAVTILNESVCFPESSTEDIPEHLSSLYTSSCVHLNENQRERLRALLLMNQSIFAKDKWDIGRTDIVTHKIDTQNTDPIRQKPRRLPFAQTSELASQIDKMLHSDIIEPFESPWSSPLVLGRKKDGSTRICLNYRKLNDITKERFISGFSKFTIRTDHSSLRWITKFKDIEGQLARWLEVLGTYDYKIVHRPGLKHSNAESLSKRPCVDCSHCEKVELKYGVYSTQCTVISDNKSKVSNSNSWINGLSDSEMKCAQREDKNLALIINLMENSDHKPTWHEICSEIVVVKALWSQWKRLEIRNDILYRRWEDDTGKKILWQLVVPDSYKTDILTFGS